MLLARVVDWRAAARLDSVVCRTLVYTERLRL